MEMKLKVVTVMGCICLCAGAWAAPQENGIQIRSIAHARTAPVSSYAATPQSQRPGFPPRVIPLRAPNKPSRPGGGGGGGNWTDPDLKAPAGSTLFTPAPVFQAQSFTGAIPPDTNLSVGGTDTFGHTEIVQIVNTSYAVYDTAGNTPLGSTDLIALFGNLAATANCNANGDGGDPIVLWDRFDKRWLIGQLAYNSDFTQNDYCLAISTGEDAAGSYDVYDIPFGGSLPDYPKLAVWGDGIYFSANMYKLKVNPLTGGVSSTFLGGQACSFPLSSGNTPPASVTFTCLGKLSTGIYNLLPADIDGPNPSVGGSDYYLQFVDNLTSTSGNELRLYQFNSGALKLLGNLAVGAFHEACGGGTCVPQLGTTQQLDSLGDRLMYRLAYRNLGSSQSMVVNHSVQAKSTSQQTGLRWYKLCNVSGAVPFSVCQQGTFAPSDGAYRWMGSIAQDGAGNLGLGYSESGGSLYPSVAVTGLDAQAGDTALEPETVIYPGPNFQDTYSRWGDYSSIAVDPNDDCTFWYTTEYSTTINLLGIDNFFWGTVIGSFHFPKCPANP